MRIASPAGRAIVRLGPYVAILGALAACVVLSGAGSLVSRPLALDEFHTVLVAGDPSLVHAWDSLRRGADYNPPTLAILLRLFGVVAGPVDEPRLRIFSYLAVYAGLIGVYRLLRAAFRPAVALAGTLATLAHPLLILHAADGRFYGPWFAATAWYCALLARQEIRPSRAGAWSVALAAILLCTIHYFGIFAWTLATVAHCAGNRAPLGGRRGWWPGLLAGPLLLAISVAIFYPGQRSAISVPTWIGKPGFSHVEAFLVAIFPALLFAIPGLIALIDGVFRTRFGEATPAPDPGGSLASLAGATGLATLPLVILAFTFLVQPAALARYAIPTLVCVGPVVVVALRSVRRAAVVLAQGAFLLLAIASYGFNAKAYEKHETLDVMAAIGTIRAREPDPKSLLILSNQRQIAFQLWRYAPELRAAVALIDPTDLADGPPTPYDRLERDVAARLHQLYGTPPVVHLADPPGAATIYLLTSRVDAARIADRFPGYEREVVAATKATCLRLSKQRP